MNKHISILVTGVAWKPLGGLKVVYDYASKMCDLGCRVNIVYSCYSGIGDHSLKTQIKGLLKYLYFLLIGDYTCSSWYNLDKRVNEKIVFSLCENNVPLSDVYIATTVQSAYRLNRFKVDNKFYFIQGFENWNKGITDDMVFESYRFNMKKIAVASWLKDLVNFAGEDCCVVYNGFNKSIFKKELDMSKRDKYTIGMMYNSNYKKGCQDCFEALRMVKTKYPHLKVKVFGIPKRPDSMPDWYEYVQTPSTSQLVDLYNSSSIFIGASHSEGWGLTIGEAMLCGCAVVCTDNKGYCEMAKNMKTALVSPIKNPSKLASNILMLLGNDNLKQEIAEKGHEFIQQFDNNTSFQTFVNILELQK